MTATVDKELYSMQSSIDGSSEERSIQEQLPSGLPQTFDRSDSPEKQNKQYREEKTFVNLKPKLKHPITDCQTHSFCIGHIPNSPRKKDEERLQGVQKSSSSLGLRRDTTKLLERKQSALNQTLNTSFSSIESSMSRKKSKRTLGVQNSQQNQLSGNDIQIIDTSEQQVQCQPAIQNLLLKALANFFTKESIEHNRQERRKELLEELRSKFFCEGGRDKDEEQSQFKRVSKTVSITKPTLSLDERRMFMPNQLFEDEKVFVTDQGLDDWIAQLYGFSTNNVPKRKPANMPQEAYDMIKKYKKTETQNTKQTQRVKQNEKQNQEREVNKGKKLTIAKVVIDPRKFQPIVINKGRKLESFIENTEPKLVYNLPAWKNIRIGLEKKHEIEQSKIKQKQDLAARQHNKHPEKLNNQKQILIRNLNNSLGNLISQTQLEEIALKIDKQQNGNTVRMTQDSSQSMKTCAFNTSIPTVQEKALNPKRNKSVKQLLTMKDQCQSQPRSLSKHFTYPQPRPQSPSWKEKKLNEKIQFITENEDVGKQEKSSKDKQNAQKQQGFVSIQTLNKLKLEMQIENARLAGEGKGANARAITAELLIRQRHQNHDTQNKTHDSEANQILTALNSGKQISLAQFQTESLRINFASNRPIQAITPSYGFSNQAKEMVRPKSVYSTINSAYQDKSTRQTVTLNQASATDINQSPSVTGRFPMDQNSSVETYGMLPTRNIQNYRSQKLKHLQHSSVDHSESYIGIKNNQSTDSHTIDMTIETPARGRSNTNLAQTFFNKMRQVSANRFSRATSKNAAQSLQNRKSSRVFQKAQNKNQLKDELIKQSQAIQKQYLFKKSRLWTFIDEKHNTENSTKKMLPQASQKILSKWTLDKYLKGQEAKVPYLDMDGVGFGHQKDQLLSPQLEEHLEAGKKFNKLLDQERSFEASPRSNVDDSHTLNQVTYGRLDYNVLNFLKDESEDEEDQVDYQIESHVVTQYGQYESTQLQNQIIKRMKHTNQRLPEQQIDCLQKELKNADNWYIKGISMNAAGQSSSAIQCYKQALIENRLHFLAMFNLAVIYMQKQKYSSAIRWFKKVIDVDPQIDQAYRGACICLFRLGKYDSAENFIFNGIKIVKERRRELLHNQTNETLLTLGDEDQDRQKSDSLLSLIYDLMYLHSLCLRRLGKFEESATIYRNIRKFYLYSDRKRMINSIFGILLLPMCDDRRQIFMAIDVMQKYMQIYSIQDDPIARPLFGTFWDIEKKGWLMKFEDDIVEELRTRNFFKRFSASDLKPFLKKMVVRQSKLQSYIFPDDQVCILMAGAVEVNYHKESVRVPVQIGKLVAGDILGFKEGDEGITKNVEAWVKCISNVESIWMDNDDFLELWEKQKKYEKRVLYEMLKLQQMFINFNEVTLHLLAFELLEQKKFSYGQVITRQNRRSLMNFDHEVYNKRQTNAVLISVLEKRKLIDRFGVDQATSTFALTLKEVARAAKINLQHERGSHPNQSVADGSIVISERTLVNTERNLNTSRNIINLSSTELNDSKYANALRLIKLPSKSTNCNTKRSIFQVDYRNGIFIIDSGRCSIVNNRLGKGKDAVFLEINRSDIFGESNQLEIAGMDYFGDIVAGSVISGKRVHHKFKKIKNLRRSSSIEESVECEDEEEVVCMYLSEHNFRRIPHYQLQHAIIAQQNHLDQFRYLACKKFKLNKEEVQLY